MIIKEIQISNFKSIVNQKIEKLTQVNMIYGYNNSGKSNLLKFINLIFSRKIAADNFTKLDQSRLTDFQLQNLNSNDDVPSGNFWEGIIANSPYIFHKNRWQSDTIEFEISLGFKKDEFKALTTHYESLKKDILDPEQEDTTLTIIGRIIGRNFLDSEIKLDKVKLDSKAIYSTAPLGSPPVSNYFETLIKGGADLKGNGYQIVFNEILSSLNDSVLLLDNDRYFVNELEDQDVFELTPRTFKNWLHNLSLNPQRNNDFMITLKELGAFESSRDPELNDSEMNSPLKHSQVEYQFSRIQGEIELILGNSHGLKLPISAFGTGIQQIIYIIAKISEKKPRIVLIEEIELNLSPMYQMQLIQHLLLKYISIVDKNLSQVFFTTHSPGLCYRDDFQILNVSISANGESAIKIVDKKQLKEFYPQDIMENLVKQKSPKPKTTKK